MFWHTCKLDWRKQDKIEWESSVTLRVWLLVPSVLLVSNSSRPCTRKSSFWWIENPILLALLLEWSCTTVSDKNSWNTSTERCFFLLLAHHYIHQCRLSQVTHQILHTNIGRVRRQLTETVAWLVLRRHFIFLSCKRMWCNKRNPASTELYQYHVNSVSLIFGKFYR